MILQELYDFAIRDNLVPDPDFETKPISWLVHISHNGRLVNIEGTHYRVEIETKSKAKDKKTKFKLLSKQFLVPRCGSRTSGDRAFFLYDKADYVFGLNVPEAKEPWTSKKLEIRRNLFLEQVKQCAEATNDEAAQSLLFFLENVAKRNETIDLTSLSEKVTSSDLFAFIYEPDINILMTERENIKNYWKNLRSPNDTTPAAIIRQCLVTGSDCSDIGLFPLIKKIPGGTPSGVGLVSFNSRAFESYGWSSNENAPVCRDAAEACSTALNRLTDPEPPDPQDTSQTLPRQNVKLSADTVACYWSRGESKFCSSVNDLFGSDPEKVGELYRSIWKGNMPSIKEYDNFYSLTLSGTQGRAILRDWFESTIDQVQKNLCQYFKDIEISRNNRSLKKLVIPHALNFLLEAVADPVKNRSETVPGHLASGLLNSAFSGNIYPETILQRAIERYRYEIGKCNDEKDGWVTRERNDARAALIKAVLNRKKDKDTENKIHYVEVEKFMDPNNKNQGYLLGRLMAVLEKLQVEALQKEKDEEEGISTQSSDTNVKRAPQFININSTIVDRFFSGASATPKATFPRLLANSKHHEKKLAEKDRGRALRYMQYIDNILFHFEVNVKTNQLNKFTEGFPQHLNINDQGLFVIGYHHMRHWLWMNKEEREVWEREYSEKHPDISIPRAYKYQIQENSAQKNFEEYNIGD